MKLLVETADCVVADRPAGGDACAEVAASLALPADALHAVAPLDPAVGGLHLFARSARARADLEEELVAPGSGVEYRALVDSPVWTEGCLEAASGEGGEPVEFRRVGARGPLSELRVNTGAADAALVRRRFAAAGMPLLGDARGGDRFPGGLRLRAAHLRLPGRGIDVSADEPEDFWPPANARSPEPPRPTLAVSRATAAVLARGHPWILPDADTGDVSRLRPGSLVEVRCGNGPSLGLARVEGAGRITARMWSSATERGAVASVEARVARALAKRRALLEPEPLDAVRLIHGEADDLPGLFVDRLGPLLRILLAGRACEPVAERVLNALLGRLGGALGPDPAVVRVVHLADPPPGRLRGVELLRGTLEGVADDAGRLAVAEGELRFWVDPGLGSPYQPRPGTGLFLDQRENRARVQAAAQGGRWLNLFCHTGAFSAAALCGGAREVTSVDLSAPYLEWLEDNLALNGLARTPHHGVRLDARRYLERLEPAERFDGIVCDPPTAARAGRRFWSVRSGGGELIAMCLARLAPGGTLLFCRNDRASRGRLEALVREVAAAAGVSLGAVEDAPPAADFPRRKGFPEAEAFDGVWVTRG